MANVITARRSGLVLRGGRNRRDTAWVAITTTNTAIAAATAVLFGGFTAAVLALRPFTIVRTRGWIGIFTDQSAATEDFHASMGFAVVSDQALAIGVTAVPTAETDKDSDLYFVFESLSSRITVQSQVGMLLSGVGREFDSKAMRKVETGQDIAITVESPAVGQGSTWHKGGRMLIKLH